MQSKLGLSSLGIWLLAITLMVGCGNEPEPMKSKSLHRFVEAPVISGVLSKDTKLIALLTSDQQISVWDTVSQKRYIRGALGCLTAKSIMWHYLGIIVD